MVRVRHFLLLAGALLFACGRSNIEPPLCGNAMCDDDESAETCAVDCGSCGDGIRGGDESCDGVDLGGMSCSSLGFGSGALSCNSDCSYNLNACSGGQLCGNGSLDFGEQCDGADLGGRSCVSEGFPSGLLTCNLNCTVNTSACCASECIPGERRCNGSAIEGCVFDPSGCSQWLQEDECGPQGSCVAAPLPVCVPSCVNGCNVPGETQCNGSTTEFCSAGPDGCLQWFTGSDCALFGQSCAVVNGTAQCSDTCMNNCPFEGATQCSGNVVQNCVGGFAGCRAWVSVQDCSMLGQLCTTAAGSAMCTPACMNTCQTPGDQRCNGSSIEQCLITPDGCQLWQTLQDCSASMQMCVQQGGSASCVMSPLVGENCATAVALNAGANQVDWNASQREYLTTSPSCVTAGQVTGPDVVLSYTPTSSGTLDVSIGKTAGNRIVAVVSDAACGSLSPALACISQFNGASMSGSFPVQAGKTVFFYVSDTSSGGAPLPDPLSVSVTENSCAGFVAKPTSFSPASGSTTTTVTPVLSVDFDNPILPSSGVISITGSISTNLSFNLAANPPQVAFSNGNRRITITPGVGFPPGEQVTVSWSGLLDATCQNPVLAPMWGFNITSAPCSPGQNGMVGSTQTSLPGSVGALAEQYVASDGAANGWVYVGGTNALIRVGKTTGTVQNVAQAANLGAAQMGYAMAINGNSVFTLNDSVGTSTGHLFRISTNAGATWSVQDYARFASPPLDDLHGAYAYRGRVFMVTHEATLAEPTQVWSVSANAATVPTNARLDATIVGEHNCSGIAADDQFLYLACGSGERLVRVNRTSQAVSVITTALPLSNVANTIVARDTTGDFVSDYLYFTGNTAEVFYVCRPTNANPFSERLAAYSGSGTSYGLGYQQSGNSLFVWSDATQTFTKIN